MRKAKKRDNLAKSSRGVFVVGLMALALAIIFIPTQCSASFGDTPRAPIYIENDDFFTFDNGVNGGGTGVAGDPYIIENWAINTSGANGITIQDTTAYFIVRNCLVENSAIYSGIYLDNVINGRIDNNTCENNKWGIHLVSSSYDNLTGNICENNKSGISLTDSPNNITTLNYLLTNISTNAYDDNTNRWDNNGKGNYWSDWQTPDADNNGIVDDPYLITGGSNQDHCPLVIGWSVLPVEDYSGAAIAIATFVACIATVILALGFTQKKEESKTIPAE